MHVLLFTGTLLYWLLSRKFRTHFGENVFPWVVAGYLLVVIHAFRAAYQLSKPSEDRVRPSQILTDSGAPFYFTADGRSRYLVAKVYCFAGLTAIVAFIPCYLIWRASHPPIETPTEEVAKPAQQVAVSIFQECRMVGMPIAIPAHDVLHLMSLNLKRFKSQNWGLFDIPNDTDKSQKWPSKEKLDEAGRQHDPGIFVYKCEVSNHSQINLADVAIPMKFWFGNAGGEANAISYAPVASPVDAGQHFVFYAVNDCAIEVTGVMPNTVRIKETGDSAWRDVALNREYRNPVEQIMIFMPTKIRWVADTPCQ